MKFAERVLADGELETRVPIVGKTRLLVDDGQIGVGRIFGDRDVGGRSANGQQGKKQNGAEEERR